MPELQTIPISALQHYLFCPRQCALIHVDGLWADNRLTAEGTLLHTRVDRPGYRTRRTRRREEPEAFDSRPGMRIVRALPLHHEALGITGKADVVEFPIDSQGHPTGPPRPVEHKRGKPKRIDADRVQLCAQAFCLESMLVLKIPEGELFYNAVRHRERVEFTPSLRNQTMATICAVRELIDANTVPRVDKAPKCRNCSLASLCLPAGTGRSRSPSRYLSASLNASLREVP